jgi:hypothetical protein
MCVGLENGVEILLASAAHPVSKVNMVRVASVNITCDHIVDGEVSAGEEVLE